MLIIDLLFAEMCIFFTQTLLSTWKATLKSRWNGNITNSKVILMRLSKRYSFEVVTSLFGLTPSPLVTLCHYLTWPPFPWPVTYFLNGPQDDKILPLITATVMWSQSENSSCPCVSVHKLRLQAHRLARPRYTCLYYITTHNQLLILSSGPWLSDETIEISHRDKQ